MQIIPQCLGSIYLNKDHKSAPNKANYLPTNKFSFHRSSVPGKTTTTRRREIGVSWRHGAPSNSSTVMFEMFQEGHI